MRRFVRCKHNYKREYENGDRKPDPSPDSAQWGFSQAHLHGPENGRMLPDVKTSRFQWRGCADFNGCSCYRYHNSHLWALEHVDSLFAPSTASISGSAS